MIEWIALAAESASVWRGNHANMAGRNFENFSQGSMNVVWRLSGTPKCQLVIRIEMSNGGVLLHRQMGVAFIEENIFSNQIGFSEPLVRLAEFQAYFLMNVAAVAVFMNARLINTDAFFD